VKESVLFLFLFPFLFGRCRSIFFQFVFKPWLPAGMAADYIFFFFFVRRCGDVEGILLSFHRGEAAPLFGVVVFLFLAGARRKRKEVKDSVIA